MKKVNLDAVKDFLKRTGRLAWGVMAHNLGWKLLSVILAVLLWFYIVSSDPTITRSKAINNVEIVVSGASVLQSRNLALLTDAASAIDNVRVYVDVPQLSYAKATADSVRVELDLSTIRQTGMQQVKLRGISTYGTVSQVIPSQIEVEVEDLDQKYVPINVELIGEDLSSYWYSVSRTNPAQITISGPSSVVEQISQALVELDVSGLSSSRSTANSFTLVNAQNEPAALSQLVSRSSSSITVGVDIYPQKQLAVSSSIDTATIGTPADGYYISSIDIQPGVITVAAAQSLLDELDFLTLEPVDVSDRKKSFATVTQINSIEGIVNPTNAQVVVTVYIEETQISQTFSDIPVSIHGLQDGLSASLGTESVSVRISGPQSAILKLSRADLTASVEAGNLSAGVFDLPVLVAIENAEGVEWFCEPQLVRITAKAK